MGYVIVFIIALLISFISMLILEIKFNYTNNIKDFFFAVQGFFIMVSDFIKGIVKKIFKK